MLFNGPKLKFVDFYCYARKTCKLQQLQYKLEFSEIPKIFRETFDEINFARPIGKPHDLQNVKVKSQTALLRVPNAHIFKQNA